MYTALAWQSGLFPPRLLDKSAPPPPILFANYSTSGSPVSLNLKKYPFLYFKNKSPQIRLLRAFYGSVSKCKFIDFSHIHFKQMGVAV